MKKRVYSAYTGPGGRQAPSPGQTILGTFAIGVRHFAQGGLVRPGSILLLNSAAASKSGDLALVSLSNGFHLTGQGTLSMDYGEYPHPDGYIQVFDRQAALAIINAIAVEKQSDPDWPGIRVSIGHPGHPGFKETDDAAHAWCLNAVASDSGITFQPEWDEEDGAKLRKKYRWFSPEWLCKKIAGNRVRPFVVTALGLTNRAVIKRARVNAETRNGGRNMDKELLLMLSLAEDAGEEMVREAVKALKSHISWLETRITELEATITNLSGERDTVTAANAEQKTKLEEATVALSNARKAHAGALLDQAMFDGRVPPGARAAWEQEFAQDHAATVLKLVNAKAVMKTGSEVASQGARGKAGESPREQIIALVNAEKAKLGDVPDAHLRATLRVKAAHPELFAAE